MRLNLKQLAFLLLCAPIFAQVQYEVNPPSHILSVRFTGPTEDQFPIIQLGEGVYLEFDDLTASEQDYYYKIIHCDYDWTPSTLLKSQYLDGVDNQRIIDYANSYNTLQPYSNYRLTIPNQNVRLRVSGNYVLEVYNTDGDLQFSRRFIVYQDLVKVRGEVKRSRDFQFLNEKQVVQFSILAGDFEWINPKQEVKVAILQNYYWPTAKYNIEPQYILGNELVYKYNEETSFYGGNEYLYFDTKDLRAPSAQISKVTVGDLYNHILFTDRYRYDEPYTYFPDINGDFVVRTIQGTEGSREAEYTEVHFSLPYSQMLGMDDVYVFGKFNNYALQEENRLKFNKKTGNMETVILMKQGFYNYKYVIEDKKGKLNLNAISGNFHFTENNYLILVYYRRFGDLYDSLIGIGNVNSRNISN
ncbi:DUF5103 domain-containing protein [Zeaxanthinibacter enoshimensis]|uniref:type IX secretion system plug protein n=1 Tax=Zeaxanthinibacter enoshimensis TaxID=392009 RepID=UPI003566AA6C